MKKIITGLLALLLFGAFLTGCGGNDKETIVVGGKDYTEQDILGNLLSVLLESNTDYNIEYVHEMASNVIFAAVQSGDVDVYIDYTGTIYGNYLNYSEMKTADEVYDICVQELAEQYQMRVLEPLGFNNTYCLAVRPDTAEQFGLRTFSDLAKVSHNMVFGGGFEILNRNDGIPNLKKVYDMSFKEEIAVEGVLRFQAITNDETQVTEAFSTDGPLLKYNLVVLEDDKGFFPPYHAVPVIREDTAQAYPEVLAQLQNLAGAISDEAMRQMNYLVDVENKDPREVAETFLRDEGLIP